MSQAPAIHLTDLYRALYAHHKSVDRNRFSTANHRSLERLAAKILKASLKKEGAPKKRLDILGKVRGGKICLDDLKQSELDLYYRVLEFRGVARRLIEAEWAAGEHKKRQAKTPYEFFRGRLCLLLGLKPSPRSFVEPNWSVLDNYGQHLVDDDVDPDDPLTVEIDCLHGEGRTPGLVSGVEAYCKKHGLDFDGLGLGVLESELAGRDDAPTPSPSWEPPPGMVSVADIMYDSQWAKHGKNPPRQTIQRWEESHPPSTREKDPATQTVYVPEDWARKRHRAWSPRLKDKPTAQA